MPFDLPQLVRFLGQAGLAVAGAAALWGFVFHVRSNRASGEQRHAFFLLERLMMPLFTGALAVYLVSWFLGSTFFFPPAALTHEGIRLPLAIDTVVAGYHATAPLVLTIAVLTLLTGPMMRLSTSAFIHRHRGKAYLAQFLLASLIMAFSVWTGGFGRDQIFFVLHNFHSIMTLGTVIAVDFLYLATANHHLIKRTLYRFFPVMSMVILAGLGLDFLSNLLIFNEAFVVSPQLLFSQTVVAIIIINGALLSGDINDALISSLHSKTSPFYSPRFRMAISISGALSSVSWLTITFVDFFDLSYSYVQLMGAFVLAVFGAFLFERFFESRLKENLGRLVPTSAE